MKIFYTILLILLLSNFAFCFETVSIPQENTAHSNSFTQECPISDEEFSKLEKIIFKKTYSYDKPQKRFERLEKEVFGMEQKGDYEDRFDNLLTASDYYKSGYRQSENTAQQKKNIPDHELNSKNYIQNYNFDDNSDKEYEQKYFAQNQSKYISPQNNGKHFAEEEKPKQKQSKIKQFFSDLIDVFSSGVITGYTPSINSFDYDFDDGFTNFGGGNFIGLPQSPSGIYIPRVNRYSPSYYNSYVPRNYYNNYPGSRYYNPPPPPPRRNYYPSPSRYNHGAGVRIIH